MAWMIRMGGRMSGILALMLFVEFLAFVLYREYGLNRLFALPISFSLVALAGYDTVKRLPLIWGALIGALLAGVDSLISWPIGAYVLEGAFRLPDEADPIIVSASFLLAAIVGAIVAVMAGVIARNRRRHRSRRSALGKLAYTAFDESDEVDERAAGPVTLPNADRNEGR